MYLIIYNNGYVMVEIFYTVQSTWGSTLFESLSALRRCGRSGTHHADLPGAAWFVVRVGGLVRGLSAHRVLERVASQGHALARIVVLVAALLVHEQLVALAGEVGGRLGGVRLCVRGGLRSGRLLARVRLPRFLLVRSRCRLLLRFLKRGGVMLTDAAHC